MPQFTAYKNQDGPGYLLQVQSDLLDDLRTRIVVPLLPLDIGVDPMHRLNPVFEVGSERFVMATQLIAAVPENILSVPEEDLSNQYATITNALDMAFHGI